MNERIKALRKTLGLTLDKFGEHIGMKKSSLSQVENGVNSVTDSLILLILKTSWNGQYVNEEWLRTGEGDMFAKLPEDDGLANVFKMFYKYPNIRRELERCAEHPRELDEAFAAIENLIKSYNNKGSD